MSLPSKEALLPRREKIGTPEVEGMKIVTISMIPLFLSVFVVFRKKMKAF